MERILASGGSVVSEYPPGTVPTKYSFLQRNRIIAGMSLGTLVTEGPKRSGALNTAMRTIENGRRGVRPARKRGQPRLSTAEYAHRRRRKAGHLCRRHPCRAGHRAEGRAPDSASLCRSTGNDAAVRNAAGQAEPETGRAHIPGGLDETRRAVCAALLAGEADFDALCAAGGMESDELGALLIEMERMAGHAFGRDALCAGAADERLKTRIKSTNNEETSREIQIAALTDSRRAGILFDVWAA